MKSMFKKFVITGSILATCLTTGVVMAYDNTSIIVTNNGEYREVFNAVPAEKVDGLLQSLDFQTPQNRQAFEKLVENVREHNPSKLNFLYSRLEHSLREGKLPIDEVLEELTTRYYTYTDAFNFSSKKSAKQFNPNR